MRRILLWILIAMLALPSAGLAAAAAQDATPGATPEDGESLLAAMGYPELRVATDGTTDPVPTELEAGRYHVILENQSDTLNIDLEFWQLPEGTTVDDVMEYFESEDAAFELPDFFFDMTFNGGPVTTAGETNGVILDLSPGEWFINVWTYDPETDEVNDQPVTVTVTGELAETEDIVADVRVEMFEMDFAVSDGVAAGPQTWHLVNTGEQIHHLILSQVPEGTTEEDVIELAGMFMEPPASPEAGATPEVDATPMIQPGLGFEDLNDVYASLPFSSGQFNVVELDLEPGTYALICFLPDPSGMPHVMMGMVEIIVVD
jgi:hypothetical protein